MRGLHRLAFGILVLGLSLVCGPQNSASAQPASLYSKLYKKVSGSTVHITAGQALGSGVILHADGYIATAAHVVETADKVVIEFINGEQADATMVTLSRSQDIALLKVEKIPDVAHAAVLGDSSKLAVGDDVFCIGSPRGLKFSASTGIISALRKDWGSGYQVHSPVDMIQTDASMNPGNSGGALFNSKGEVIGLASKVVHDQLDQSVNSTGLGLAVPSNLMRKRLFENGLPYIGVLLNRIPHDLAAVLNWPAQECLLVERVQPGSLSDKAGLLGGRYAGSIAGFPLVFGGDLIYKVGGHSVSDAEAVHKYLHDLKEGDKVEYKVWRAGRYLTVEVPLEAIVTIPQLEPLPGAGVAGESEEPDVSPKGSKDDASPEGDKAEGDSGDEKPKEAKAPVKPKTKSPR